MKHKSTMKNLKKITLLIPEFLLVLAVLFYWVSTANLLNPFAIVLLLALIGQMIFKNKVVGLIIPSFLILASLFLLLALMSEFNEFPTFSYEAKRLLFVGLTFFISTIVVSGIMIYKYSGLDYDERKKSF